MANDFIKQISEDLETYPKEGNTLQSQPNLLPGAVPLSPEEEALANSNDFSFLDKPPVKQTAVIKPGSPSLLNNVKGTLIRKFYGMPDNDLTEAHKLNKKTKIPVNAILSSPEAFANAKTIAKRQEEVGHEKLLEEYPKLKSILQDDPLKAAIALKNIENVKRTHGIIEAAVTSWQAGQDNLRKARLGWKEMSGQQLSKQEQQELAQIQAREKKQKSLPGLTEDPLSAMVGGVAQNLPMMIASSAEGLKVGMGTGMATGGAAALASSPLIATGVGGIGTGVTTAGATALGFNAGFQAGVGKDLAEQMSGLQYYSLLELKDEKGKPLLNKTEAKTLAALTGVIEAGIEVSNLDKVLTFIKPAERAIIKKIIKEATIDGRFSKDAAKLAMKRYMGKTAKGGAMVAGTETLEETLQGTIEIAAEEYSKGVGQKKGLSVEYRTGKEWGHDIADATIEALPATLGFGFLSAGPRIANTPRVYREFSKEISEQQKKIIETQSGVNAVRQLKEVQSFSKMAKEAPDIFANTVASQVEGTPFAEVRIDIQALAQDQGLGAIQELAVSLGKTEEINTALELGLDVVVPMEEYAQSILPNPVASQIENYIKFSEDGTILARVKERAEELTEKYNKIIEEDNLKGQQFADNFIDTYFTDETTKGLAQEILQRNPVNPQQGYNEISRELQKEMKQIIREKAKELDNGQYTKEQLEVAAIAELADNEDFTAKQEKLQALQQVHSVFQDLPSEEVSSLKGLSPEGLQIYRTTKERIKNSGTNKDVIKASHAGALFIARHAERYAEAMRASGRPFTAEDYLEMRGLGIQIGGITGELKQFAGEKAYNQDNRGLLDWEPDGNRSYRFSNSTNPMSDYGHAMFADNPETIYHYGKNAYSVNTNDLILIENLEQDILKILDNDRESGILEEYSELSNEEILASFNPVDIVNSAEAFDNKELTLYFMERVANALGVKGIKTKDGAVVFNEKIIAKDKDAAAFYHEEEIPKSIKGTQKEKPKENLAYINFMSIMKEKYSNEDMWSKMTDQEFNEYQRLDTHKYDDEFNQDIRGSIGFAGDGQVIIKLFESANQSTFLHESGHLFVQDLKDLAEMENTPEQIKKDWETVKEFLSWQEGQKKFTVEQQEKWATAFEAYLMEGKAPATSLQRIFRQLKAWLTKIYKDFVALGGKPPKEIRQVMDRMIASEEEIENSIILNDYKAFEKNGGTAVLAGSTQEMYFRMSQDSKEEAKEKMLAKLMRDMSKEQKAVVEGKVAEEGKRIREEVEDNPIFKAKEILDFEDMKGASLEEKEVLLNTLGYLSYDEYLNELAKEGITELDPTEKQFVNMLQDKPIEEIEKSLKARLDQIYQTELDYLKNSGGQGVEQGSLLRDETTGEVINRVGRISKNPQWYRDFFKSHGRKPTQAELKELAQKRLSEGYEDEEAGFVEPNEEYINLANSLERIKVIKEKLAEINKMPAGNIIESVVTKKVQEYRESLENELLNSEKLKEEAERLVRGPLRLQVLAMELATLSKRMLMAGIVETPTAEKADQKVKDTESNLRVLREEAIASARAAQQSAMFALEKLPLKESANTKLWINKERQAAIKVDKAMAAKKWEEAVYWKERQMLFSAMAKYSYDLNNQAQKWIKNINKKQKSKVKMPLGHKIQLQRLFYRFGFVKELPDLSPNAEDNASLSSWLQAKMDNEFETNQVADWIISGGDTEQYGVDYTMSEVANLSDKETKTYRVKGWKSLTFEQLKDINDAITSIYTLGRNEFRMLSINGKPMEEVIEELVESINKNDLRKRDALSLDIKTGIRKLIDEVPDRLNSWILKPETLIHELDGFQDDGPAMKYLYNLINDARNEALKMQAKAAKEMANIFSVYSNAELADMKTKKVVRDPVRRGDLLTKEQLLLIGLNWGNMQNRQRLADGYKWTPEQVEEMLSSLNARDWKVIQDIWDWINGYWDDIVKLEVEFNGVVPEKVEATPFSIGEHELRGGYFPIKYDPEKSNRAGGQEEDLKALMEYNGAANAATRRQHVNKRAEQVKRPLLLESNVIVNHVTSVIHDLTHRKAIRDVNRILKNTAVEEAIVSALGMKNYRFLTKFLKDVALNGQEAPLGDIERIVRKARTGLVSAVMGYRLSTAILNFLNLFPAIDYMGAPRVMRGIISFYASPKEQIEFIREKSAFMSHRFTTMDRDVREATSRLLDKSKIPGHDGIKNSSFHLMMITDSMVSMPLWLEEYKAKLARYSKTNITPEQAEKKAIDAADAAVRRLVGSGEVKDLAAVQKNGELSKALTMFYSYFNLMYNMLYRRRRESVINQNPLIFFQSLALWLIIPATLEAAFKSWVQMQDGDEWDWEEFIKRVGANILGQGCGTIPILREIGSAAIGIIAGQYSNYRMSPVEDVGQRILNVVSKSKKALEGDGEWIDVSQALTKAANPFTGMPDTITDGLWSIARLLQGDYEGEFGTFVKDVVFDRKKKD